MTDTFKDLASKIESAKHSQKVASAARDAEAQKREVAVFKIVSELVKRDKALEKRVSALECFAMKPGVAKVRVGKVVKKQPKP